MGKSEHDEGMEKLAAKWSQQDEAYRRLGQEVAHKVELYLAMVNSGVPRSGAEHWLAGEVFDAVRMWNLLPEKG